ncbi:MAG: hypothetical protein D6813_02060 [Calditrichaeota bacterium]|nr:MAG: hypothetical protein D6813_02060 [Calditrichota bacterium]
MKSITIISITLIISGFLVSKTYAQGGFAGSFLRIGVGARAKAMGDAYTALARGIETSYYNPAGLPLLQHAEFMASFRVLALDRRFTFLGFGVPIHPKIEKGEEGAIDGAFAISWIQARVGDIDGRDSDGRSIGEFSNSENAFIFSFALNPVPALAFGLSVKVLLNRFPDIGINGQTLSSTGVGFDFGVLLRPTDWLSLGIAIKDINSKYRWNTDKLYGEDGSEVFNKFPKILRLGTAVKVPKIRDLTLAFDFEDSEELDARLHFGAEKIFKEGIVLRAGLDDQSITAGAGYQFDFLGKTSQLNYAFTAPGDRPEEEHIFTWVFQF